MSSPQAIAYQNVKDENTTTINSEQEATNPKPTLLGLPGEIRNKIWRFSATHERIQLPQAPQTTPQTLFRQLSIMVNRTVFDLRDTYNRLLHLPTSNPTNTAPAANPSFGMLCTNRQIYEESHFYYWTLNAFFLPHGPLSHTVSFFDSIAPEHKAMIKHIGMHLSIADLTPQVINIIESRCTRPIPANYAGTAWADIASMHLQELWTVKLNWLNDWTGLESVAVEDTDRWRMVRDESTRRRVSDKETWDLVAKGRLVGFPMWWFLQTARNKVRSEVFWRVMKVGWRGLKREVQSRGAGS